MVLLGQKLKPLTIGHLFLLERFECLPVEDIDQLIFAVLICSHDHEEVIPALENRWTNLKIRFWSWRLGKVDWLSKYELWQEYYERSTATPCVVQKRDNDIGDSATPFLQHVKVTLQSKLNYTPPIALPNNNPPTTLIPACIHSKYPLLYYIGHDHKGYHIAY